MSHKPNLFRMPSFLATLGLVLCCFNAVQAQQTSLPTASEPNECESSIGSNLGTCYTNANTPCPLWPGSTVDAANSFNAAVLSDFNVANTCYYAPAGTTPSPYIGARTQPGTGQAIDVWGSCYYITDSSNVDSYFIPFKSSPEWTDFISSSTSGTMQHHVHLNSCARSFLYQAADTDVPGYTTPVPAGDPAAKSPEQLCGHLPDSHLPYWPTGQSLSRTITMPNCAGICYINTITNDTQCGSAWTASVTLGFTALNGNDPALQQKGLWWSETPSAISLPVTLPKCDPRSTTYSTGSCSASCGGGTQSTYAIDGCGQKVVISTQSCNVWACNDFGASNGAGGGNKHDAGSYGFGGVDANGNAVGGGGYATPEEAAAAAAAAGIANPDQSVQANPDSPPTQGMTDSASSDSSSSDGNSGDGSGGSSDGNGGGEGGGGEGGGGGGGGGG